MVWMDEDFRPTNSDWLICAMKFETRHDEEKPLWQH